MAVGVTILLSLAVFFLMVEEKLPVSENLPLIGKYYCSTIIEVSLSLAAMCYVLRYVHHRPCALPVWKRVSKENRQYTSKGQACNSKWLPLLPWWHFTLGILFQKYILGYLARIVFYKTGQEKAEQETSNKKAQSNSRDSRENEKNEKVARKAVNKWRKRKIPITILQSLKH